MNCPNCSSPVLNVLTAARDPDVRIRLRRCADCGYEVRTIELPASSDLIRYRCPVDPLPGARRGSKLAVVAAKRHMVRNAITALGDLG